MGLSPTQADVLDELVTRLPDDGSWCLFGSVDSVLRGLDDDPSDVDVLATAAGAASVRDAFHDEFVGTREPGASRIDEYRIRGEEVEVVYSDRTNDDQEPLVDLETVDLEAVDLETVEIETTADRAVPVLPLQQLCSIYRSIDKRETAARLEARLSSASE